MITTITSILFFFSAAVLILYWAFLFSKLLFYNEKAEKPQTFPGVSVIIAARNESSNLRANLPGILTQKYPTFEVIVVNDHSTDETPNVLAEFAKNHAHLSYSSAPAAESGKKKAITLGIQMAKHDLILTTDADCNASDTNWLKKMVTRIGQKHVLLGYGPMFKTAGLLNGFSRFETTMTAIQYFSWALAGHPYMGVGRNLMYQKQVFDQVGGFDKHISLKSGDDDLFIQAATSGYKVGICIDPSTFMYSAAKEKWQLFRKQKIRHLSTSFRYKRLHQAGLTLFAAAQMIFYPTFFILCLMNQSLTTWIAFLTTIVVKWSVFAGISKKLAVQDIFFYFPFFDFAYSMYLWVLVPHTIFTTPIEWKSS